MSFLRQRLLGAAAASRTNLVTGLSAAPGSSGGGGTDNDPETLLVEAARRGDRAAFDTLVHAHEPLLRGFLLRRIGPDVLDDLLQEVWLACWVAMPRFQRRSCFKTWLYSIALNKCMDHHRAQKRAPAPLQIMEGGGVVDGEIDWRSPEDLYAAAELRESVRQLLSELPPAQREVLDLYYYAELTLPEIATVLKRNLNTVKYQFYRGHDLVAGQMETIVGRTRPRIGDPNRDSSSPPPSSRRRGTGSQS